MVYVRQVNKRRSTPSYGYSSKKRKFNGRFTGAMVPYTKKMARRISSSSGRPISKRSRGNGWGTVAALAKHGIGLASGGLPYAAGVATDYALNKVVDWVSGRGSKRGASGRTDTTGSYAGRWRKGRSNRTLTTRYANKGVVLTQEVNGTLSDPDCVYITHTAADVYKVITTATDALFRKLFQKAGMVITNMDQILDHTGVGQGADYTIQLTAIAGQTGAENIETQYVTISTSTPRTVAAEFYNTFLTFSGGYSFTGAGTASSDRRLHRLILFTQDYNVTMGKIFKAELVLADEVMNVLGISDLKVQNRTLAADGGAEDDHVSNNPLVGRSYQFKNIPLNRDKAAYALNAIPWQVGVQLVRAAQMTANVAYKEPPEPTVFSNCFRSAVIRIEPGQVKATRLIVRKRMPFLTFLRTVNIQTGATPGFHMYNSPFPSELIALEDVINVNAAQNIQLAYEANQQIGVYFTTRRHASAVMTYAQTTHNNNPA